jgi:hypothetical protein
VNTGLQTSVSLSAKYVLYKNTCKNLFKTLQKLTVFCEIIMQYLFLFVTWVIYSLSLADSIQGFAFHHFPTLAIFFFSCFRQSLLGFPHLLCPCGVLCEMTVVYLVMWHITASRIQSLFLLLNQKISEVNILLQRAIDSTNSRRCDETTE